MRTKASRSRQAPSTSAGRSRSCPLLTHTPAAAAAVAHIYINACSRHIIPDATCQHHHDVSMALRLLPCLRLLQEA
eukprot:COSAG06_NODE_14986_length_1108_cov_19.817641_2_plen_76_part_00